MQSLSQLSSNVWITEVKLSEYSVRGVLIVTENEALIWDTLSHPLDMRPFISKIADREVTIIYSHADWDHIWGTGGLPYKNMKIIGHTKCLERFSNDVPMKLKQKRTNEPFRWDAVKLIAPNTTFEEELTVRIGQRPLTLRHLPGHTSDSIVAFLPSHGILLMGDTVETPFPVVPNKSSLPLWISELKRWEQDSRVKTVVPAHGNIGGREILLQNITYLQHLLNGNEIKITDTLTDFYSKTHKANMRALENNV